jgi:hypothetical protein
MLSLAVDQAWFSYQEAGNPGGLGRLDPSTAPGVEYPALPTSQPVTPACTHLPPVNGGTLTPVSSQAGWASQSYPVSAHQAGLLSFQLPANGLPFGIAVGDSLWLVDQGRAKLARLPYPQIVACKLADVDGNLATSQDQLPVAGWPIYLRLDSLRQEPARVTGPDGCVIWSDRVIGENVGVEEDPGSLASLTPLSVDFGLLGAGQTFTYNFISQAISSIFLPIVQR